MSIWAERAVPDAEPGPTPAAGPASPAAPPSAPRVNPRVETPPVTNASPPGPVAATKVPGYENLTPTQAEAWLSLVEIVYGEFDWLDPFTPEPDP